MSYFFINTYIHKLFSHYHHLPQYQLCISYFNINILNMGNSLFIPNGSDQMHLYKIFLINLFDKSVFIKQTEMPCRSTVFCSEAPFSQLL